MTRESFILRTTISSQLMKHALFKGFAIAFLGILLALLAGVFIPSSLLQKWGWSVFLISFGLMTWGLFPYRRLSRLQLKPNQLVLTDVNHLNFYSKGTRILTLPLQSVNQMSYVDDPTFYGIAVWFKPIPISPIVMYELTEVNKLRQYGQKMGGADLFFPYFNQRSYEELMTWREEESCTTKAHFE